MKKVLSKLEETKASKETIDEFKKAAPAAVKKIVANCDNYDFFVGESFDAEAMYAQPSSLSSDLLIVSTH